MEDKFLRRYIYAVLLLGHNLFLIALFLLHM